MKNSAAQREKTEAAKTRRALSCVQTSVLTCVTAPAGYRKAKAVRGYLAEYGIDALWMNLYWDQDELLAFWNVFAQAVRRQFPEAYERISDTDAPRGTGDAIRVLGVLEEACQNKQLALVINNYDRAETTKLNKLLQGIIECLPEQMRLIIISETMPQFVSHGYLFFEHCKMIGKDELSFDLEDAAATAREVNCLLDRVSLERLLAYTNGWPSLTESILSNMPGSRMNTAYVKNICIRAFSQAATEQLDMREKEILMVLCHLDRFDAEQANEIIGYESSELLSDLLAHMAVDTVFLDQQGDQYTICDSAKEYLRRESSRVGTPRVLAGERNLIRWLLISDRIGDALRLLHCQGNLNEMLRLLEEYTVEQISELDSELLVELFQKVDFAQFCQHPTAAIQIAFLLMKFSSHAERGKDLLLRLRDYVKENPDQYNQNDILGQIDLALASNADKRLRINSLIKVYSDARGSEDRGIPSTWIVPSFLCGIHNLEGHLLAEMKDFAVLCEENGLRGFSNPILCANVAQAEYYLEIGNASKAIYSALEGLPEQGRSDSITLCAYFTMARACLLIGDNDKVHSLVNNLQEMADRSSSMRVKSLVDICIGYLYSCLEEWDKVPAWICREEDGNRICKYSSYAYIIRAKYLLAQNDSLAFELLSRRWFAELRHNENLFPKIHYHILKAISAQGMYGMENAASELQEAFSIALPDDITAPFVENGERLLPILQYAQNDNSLKLPDEYAVTLSQMLSKAMNKPITFSAGNKSLTKREEQILLLLGSGLSYAEIASTLVISKFTVQKHIQNIYDKLNVSDRVNAIIRAKEYWGIG